MMTSRFLVTVFIFPYVEVVGLRVAVNGNVVDGPFTKTDFNCNEKYKLQEGEEKSVCVAGWDAIQKNHQGKPCVVYEVGLRTASQFALKMIQDFGCVVRAYDPSPVTAEWWDNEVFPDIANKPKDPAVALLKSFQETRRFELNRQAASEQDGNLNLFEADWDQVSIFQATKETQDKQNKFTVPAKSYSTMIKDNGDTFIDVMKIDIEGSEFKFLKGMFDTTCPDIEFILLEWHSKDMNYELGSPSEVHEAEDRMKKCGFKKFSAYPFYSWNPTTGRDNYQFSLGDMWYGHGGYCRTCWQQ